ncbi:hypothetical protein GPECTOR_69g404 [Gonium pectorale]|uniref:Uncharacterized protein n=1 Tax=Gonium pectorale TaxID=33097 RepID=A0A150G3E1_GONPE|nr:hypothetical protein GPECTOR_69g404 [Gonium pectorale]|eukprot:KXZ44311.1 hypothetical protein GPECTOR_69g404 [Gonium pectorale]
MDAATMQFAMEQMKKMNPEQLQAMMRSMPPDMMGAAMAQMKDMKPEDWERAKQQMAGMDADTMARQAAAAQAQMAGRTQYVLNASNQLKQEGNALHGRGEFAAAVEKYERAKSNVESFTSKEAKDLIRACTLNLSSCYLNLKQFGKCVEQCNQVLTGEPDNLKALYRRGQAHMGSGAWLEAAGDLERALRLAKETDPSQTQPIRDKLQEAKDQAQEMMRGMDDEQLRAMGRQMGMDVSPEVLRGGMADMDPELMKKMVQLQAELPPDLRGPDAARNPESVKKLAELMERKPDMAATLGEMLSSVPQEKLQDMARSAGLPPGVTITPELAKAAAESFKRMSPEEVKAAVDACSNMPAPPPAASSSTAARAASNAAAGTSGRGDGGAAAAAPAMPMPAGMPAMDPRLAADMLAAMTPDQLEAMTKMMPGGEKLGLTPEMAKMAADMMKNMSAEDIARMQEMTASMHGIGGGGGGGATVASSSSGGPAGAPAAAMPAAGGMAAMAADMMKNMTPEDMARMQEMAAKLGMGPGGPGGLGAGLGGLGGLGGAGGGDPMAAMLNDPKMMESAMKMMKSMDPEALVGMMMSSGMCKDRAQAEAMAHQMSSMSETQLNMMIKAATAVQRARAAGQQALAWARRNVWLVAAVLVLLIGLLLRRLGYM